jgi:hypothetical protein
VGRRVEPAASSAADIEAALVAAPVATPARSVGSESP